MTPPPPPGCYRIAGGEWGFCFNPAGVRVREKERTTAHK